MELEMTLNRLNKLKAQVITEIGKCKSVNPYESFQVCKLSSPERIYDSTSKASIAYYESEVNYLALTEFLYYIKNIIFEKNGELNVSCTLNRIERIKARISYYTTALDNLPGSGYENIYSLDELKKDINSIISKISMESEFSTIRLVTTFHNADYFNELLLSLKKELNAEEDYLLHLNATKIKISIDNNLIKILGL
jgi:hypothetical protein